MSHKVLINGTAHEVVGGRTLIGGTGYDIASGKVLVGGTAYDISFGSGEFVILEEGYGDPNNNGIVNGSMANSYIVNEITISRPSGTSSSLQYVLVGTNGFTASVYIPYFQNGALKMIGAASEYSDTNIHSLSLERPVAHFTGVDITNYNKLCVRKSSATASIKIGLKTDVSKNAWTAVTAYDSSSEIIELDISGYSGSGYAIGLQGSTGTVTLTKVWLE